MTRTPVSSFAYDARHQLSTSTDANMRDGRYGYDSVGNRLSASPLAIPPHRHQHLAYS